MGRIKPKRPWWYAQQSNEHVYHDTRSVSDVVPVTRWSETSKGGGNGR
jgi:hypothetical protein